MNLKTILNYALLSALLISINVVAADQEATVNVRVINEGNSIWKPYEKLGMYKGVCYVNNPDGKCETPGEIEPGYQIDTSGHFVEVPDSPPSRWYIQIGFQNKDGAICLHRIKMANWEQVIKPEEENLLDERYFSVFKGEPI